jgi:hypothetical protein
MDCQPVKVRKLAYQLQRKYCPKCCKLISAKPPGVLAKCLYSNRLLTYVAVGHYIYGNTLGQIERQTGIGYSSLVDAMHHLSKRFKGVADALIQQYRRAPVKHPDETGWRTDGQNGYSWLFCTNDFSIVTRQARHPAIWKIQGIFREKADRLYHWAGDRNVPADNNLAERELRPLVIARKLSFGSQSEAGARTRETLMTVLHTLRKTSPDVADALSSVLDKLADHTNTDPAKLLFVCNSS